MPRVRNAVFVVKTNLLCAKPVAKRTSIRSIQMLDARFMLIFVRFMLDLCRAAWSWATRRRFPVALYSPAETTMILMSACLFCRSRGAKKAS